MNKFKIADFEIREGCKPLLIAEIGQNHDGSLGMAHAYIDAVADAGAEAVKFQTHIAKAESSLQDKFRVQFSYEDKTRFDYWQRMEFTRAQWAGLYSHANEKGLIFLSSPFSMEAAELLDSIGCPAWKIGSGEVNNDILLKFFGETGKPVLLSTGMSTYDEIHSTVQKIRERENPLAIFQCTSKYPTDYTDIGLNIIDYLKSTYQVPIGFSDHSGDIFPVLYAMARGVSLVEVHVTFHKSMFGPDVKSSVTLDELKLVAKGAEAAFVLNNHLVDKDEMATELQEMKSLFQKSLAVTRDVLKGEMFTEEIFKGLKPGNGIPVNEIEKVIGKKANKDIKKNSILFWDDIS